MKKRKYLYRLIAVIILILVIPVIVLFEFFGNKSLEEMEKANEVYYDKMLDSYISLYDEIVQELNMFAASISADSKVSSGILWNGVEELKGDYLQLYNVAMRLGDKYGQKGVANWSIYLYDLDKIIKNGVSTLTSMQFIYDIESRHGANEQLTDFFSLESYNTEKPLFCEIPGKDIENGQLLIGICIRVGKNNDKALVYFSISPSDIEDSLVIMNEQGMEFYLVDKETEQIVFAWGDNAGKHVEKIVLAEDTRPVAGMQQKVLYKKDSNYTPYSIITYISEETLQSIIVDYVYSMRKLLIFAVLIMVLLCLGAIYIAYRPVYDLTSELGCGEGSEFENIRNLLYDRHTKIKEQEMLIMDLLINHLVCGVHVSEKRIKRLGIDATMKYYYVCLLEGYVLASHEEGKLIQDVEQKQHLRLFVTDWQGENKSIFILFSKTEDITESVIYLREWLERECIDTSYMYVGEVVDKLDDIQKSLRSCFEQAKKKAIAEKRQIAKDEASNNREEVQKQLKEQILAYLDVNFRDVNLSQMQVADMFRISNYTLSRLFKNQVGVGFTEYLLSKRMEYAKELLLTTSYSISEISCMAGFSGIDHFSKKFKSYVGISPTSFRDED